jgi:hypothetical protein
MNLREGTRRLALIVGITGACLGCIASYSELKTVRDLSAHHAEFERLTAGFANSKLAQQMRRDAEHDPSDNSITPDCCGIEEIFWDKNHIFNDPSGVYSITTEDGRSLYPTPAPGAGSYALIAALPILGFLLPWGVIRAVGWVLAGFVQPSH